jgi:nucleoside-diphosphate-sugar epimerase
LTILVTGASGFVGSAVLNEALRRGLKIRPVFRTIDSSIKHYETVIVPELNGATDWSQSLRGVDVLIHAAARTHYMKDKALDSLVEYRRVNVHGTINLARQAAHAGVRRFVFISSIKVNGESTDCGCLFTADDDPAPGDAYSLSKAEAELLLMQVAHTTGMEVTIIRPPLIYGAGVKGNFLNLIKLVKSGLPLPLGSVIHNRRSFVGLDNLVDLILVCAKHPQAANQIFLISDGEDLSTSELLVRMGKALGRPTLLLRFPPGIISFVASLFGKRLIFDRLLGSLQVDIRKTCELLDWIPSVTIDEGLSKAVDSRDVTNI